jgi:hypothetical protein
VDKAALADSARQALLDRPDDAGRPVAHHQERIGQTPAAKVLEELLAARRVLLRARRQVQQRLLAVGQNAPGRQNGLTRLAQMQPLGNPVDEQVDDLELRQIAARKGLVLRRQPLRDLAYRRPA